MSDLFGEAPAPKKGRGRGPSAPARSKPAATRPLADRLRPTTLAELVGQDHLLARDAPLGRMLATRHLASIVLWGPPGCGKTTLARLIARELGLPFVPLSAVMAGVADLRRVFEDARRHPEASTLLFIDEIHRFNRAQQDGLLHEVEDGTVVLVGATTENPSFALTGALLSRCQVLVLHRLDATALETLLARAEDAIGHALPLDDGARARLLDLADGDGRYLINMAESLADLPPDQMLDTAALSAVLQRRMPLYDKSQEGHYNLISALHKAVRGSDVDAALYWLCRMLDGGEDPRFLGRRLVRMASEDIGLADPQALLLARAACEAYEQLGSPEGELALAEATVHMALAPKSNALYKAFGAAMRSARTSGSLMPPAFALNAPTKLMKELGYGEGYRYDHHEPGAFAGQDYFPPGLERETFYRPSDRGAEAGLRERLDAFARIRRARAAEDEDRR